MAPAIISSLILYSNLSHGHGNNSHQDDLFQTHINRIDEHFHELGTIADEIFINNENLSVVNIAVHSVENTERGDNIIKMGEVIKVTATYEAKRNIGNPIFYIKPIYGAPNDALLSKGYYSNKDAVKKALTSFYIPYDKHLIGESYIYVLIPNVGIGRLPITITE